MALARPPTRGLRWARGECRRRPRPAQCPRRVDAGGTSRWGTCGRGGHPPPAPRAWQVTSSPLLSRSVWIWAVGWVLCLHLLVKVRGWGNGHILEGAVQCRDQASWTFTSFLVTFVLLIHGADVITCWTDWCLGNPVSGSHGPFLLNPSG